MLYGTLLIAQAGHPAWHEFFDEGLPVQRHLASSGRLSLSAITRGGPVLASKRLRLVHISIFRSELRADACLACDFVVPHSAFVGLSFFFYGGPEMCS